MRQFLANKIIFSAKKKKNSNKIRKIDQISFLILVLTNLSIS